MQPTDKYPDFEEKIAKKIEEEGSEILGLKATLALASLLDEKGIIKYEDYIDKFYESLATEE
ncbi:hypothetical protein [Planococcus halotolerans]|uniref:Uncharacterized protein n=1 Tax=Planococcus halotolerans TaxID=2233542 RepID=A0A365KKF1_9BACL|nr:hypothetical protein [Planococcus halotolerans]RAZ73617.1 hypothetical protein DP120_16915 [Planococcus halotolerans]